MLLKKLKLVNFRQFYSDKTEIEFSTDDKKNITLIHGENGVGKTTILNALLWCLYEKTTPDFEQKHELISLQAIKEGVKSCRVELSFEYEGKEYLAQRNFQNTGQVTFKVFEIVQGNHDEVPNNKAFINSILPNDMAEYFFFHGEGVSNINAKQAGEKFRRAIRDILGFRLAETAIDDLKEINKSWTKELTELKNVSKEQSELIKRKLLNEDKLERLESVLVTLNTDKEIYSNDLEEVLIKLRNCSVDKARQLQHQVDELERRNSSVNNKILATKAAKQNLINKYGSVVFGQKLANQALDFIDKQSIDGTIPAPYDEKLVNDLIKREFCICGRELKVGTTEFLKVTNLIEKANNAGIRDKLTKAIACGSNIQNRKKDFLDDLKAIETRLSEQDIDKRDIEASLVENRKNLQAIDIEEVRNLELLKSTCQKKITFVDGEIAVKKREIQKINDDIQEIRLKLKRFGAEDIRISRLTEHQSYADKLIKLCGAKLDQYEAESKKTIATKVNETLQDFSRKDFKVRVSDDFSFFLVREDGERVAKSKGENLLLNLAFVSALIEFAQMRSGASGDFLVSGTTAPFVIDAPFGELDNTYKKATAKFLPKRSRQLIFLLSSSHWTGAVDETIKNKIGSEYVLISSKSSVQNGKPEDKLTIDGNEYIQSLYNQDKDATFIEKVK
jgi:DNA sulfur modification protein DndD